jgi:hypothetical protein
MNLADIESKIKTLVSRCSALTTENATLKQRCQQLDSKNNTVVKQVQSIIKRLKTLEGNRS